ncbi:MAG: IPT/TIG domain-containing protein [Acidimicrobiales bacterium]
MGFALGAAAYTADLDARGSVTLDRSDAVYEWRAGDVVVTVQQFGGGRVENDTFTFTVDAPTPSIESVEPETIGVGAVDQDVVITGTDFVDGATVTFSNGVQVTATDVESDTEITVTITTTGATPGSVTVTVDNNQDAPVGSIDDAFVLSAAPTISSIEPASAARGSTDVTVVITGTDFGPTVTVELEFEEAKGDVTVVSTAVDSPTQVTVVLDVGGASVVGLYDVVLTNDDAGRVTASEAFEVTS